MNNDEVIEILREFSKKHPALFSDYMQDFNNHPISEIIDYMWDMHAVIEEIECYYDSEVDQMKEYIEQNKNKTCENCAHYLENIGYCEVINRTHKSPYYTCNKWTERGDSDE